MKNKHRYTGNIRHQRGHGLATLILATNLFVVSALCGCAPRSVPTTGSAGPHETAEPVSGPLIDSDSTVTFFALGDQGVGGSRQHNVAAMMEANCRHYRDLNFVLLLGDNFMSKGVRSVSDRKWRTRFERVYGTPCLGKLPFYAALGNHDYQSSPQAQIEYSQQRLGSARWRMPHFYYTRDFGRVNGRTLLRLVVLDTTKFDDAQLSLLESAFGGNDNPVWKLVAGHSTIRSFDARRGDIRSLTERLLPTLRKYKVDIYLSGHSHNLQLIARPGEPLYVISGGGGNRLYEIAPDTTGALIYGQVQHGFVTIQAAADELVLSYRTGREKDNREFRVTRRCMNTEDRRSCLIP